MTRTQQIDLTERSTLDIIRSIADDTSTLVRKEAQLAREELLEAVTARVKAVAAFAGAGVFAMLGLVFGGLAGATALARVVPAWAAALIVCGAFFVLAMLGVAFARARISRPSLVPSETVRTIKEDVEWTKQQLKR
jgi:predicted phage tail protein